MGFKEVLQISLLPLLILFSISGFAIATDPVDISSRVLEAQNALNVQGFTPTNSLGMEFSDSIDPYTGALTITQTDVSLPGRNGMNIKLTRTYSSNIYSNINQYTATVLELCEDLNDVACPECITPDIISGQKLDYDGLSAGPIINRQMHKCDIGGYSEGSSYIESKMFGLGWDMTPGRIKDPTPLLYTKLPSGNTYLTFQSVSSRGITSQSMILDNNEQSLILPSQFSRPSELTGIANPADGINYQWSNRLGNSDGAIKSYRSGDLITKAQNTHSEIAAKQTYTAYTSSLSPIFMKFPTILEMATNGPQGSSANKREAVYYSKDGKSYEFRADVNFCNEYDDMVSGLNSWGLPAYCNEIEDDPNTMQTDERESVFTWVQNPYAGIYLTKVKDKFGNYIDYTYYDSEIQSPFINYIQGGAPGQYVKFNYASNAYGSVSYPSNRNFLVDSLEYSSPSGYYQNLFVGYTYKPPEREVLPAYNMQYASEAICLDAVDTYDNNHAGKFICEYSQFFDKWSFYRVSGLPLLIGVTLYKNGENEVDYKGHIVPGTTYKYDYNDANELIRVTLPHGAIIEYEYAWATDIPSYDLLRKYSAVTDFQKITRRVVVKKTVINGGYCPTRTLSGGVASGGQACVWVYQYETVPKGVLNVDGITWNTVYEMETSIHDPFGGKQVYKMMPATYSSLNYR